VSPTWNTSAYRAQFGSATCASAGYAAGVSSRGFFRAFVLFVGLCAAARAHAEPVLHEYVPNVEPGEATPAAAGGAEPGGLRAERPSGDDGANTDARAGEVESEAGPAYEATAGDGSPGEPPGRRSPSFRPDRLTELANGLDYYEVFRPSIAPFKRVTALGLVHLDVDGKTPVLAARDHPRTVVPIESERSRPPDARPRDRFTAKVRLDFREGPLVPLPSVSPESRILSLRATPAVPLQVERDADDNFAVRLLGRVPEVPVEVELTTDAPRSYFGTAIPNARVNALEAEVPKLERSIETRALAMAKRMRLNKRSDLRRALETLTHYFRAFEESKEPPENTGDLYLDLVRSQKGICRHRAYGFIVTAQALGIPTRFVQNEAHSWVEVKLPQVGFMRIDLGGAANGLTAHNASDGPSYVPSQPDPLPQPPSYRRAYAEAAAARPQSTQAPTPESIAGRWLSKDSIQADPNAPPSNDDAIARSGLTSAGPPPGTALLAEAPSASSADGTHRAERKPLVIRLHERAPSALRGAALSLSGRVVDDGSRGVAGLRVEVWIASRGEDKAGTTRSPAPRDERMLLGVCVTDPTGAFQTSLGVPPDILVGDYRLIVLTPGDTRYAAAVAP
jgi:transglutaminase-like putative cysteine protease